MREQGAGRIVPLPSGGRVHTASRRARFGDVGADGLLRLDALAAYLQDVSSDDTADAGLGDDPHWVVRRAAVEVHRAAGFREVLTVRTACSGLGSRWAERRVSVRGEAGGARLEAATLWVRLDPATGRPALLDPAFLEVYGGAAAGRQVHARLAHDPEPPPGATRHAWTTRRADLDPLGHVNNAVAWAVVEELVARQPGASGIEGGRFEVEFRRPIQPGDGVELAVAPGAPDATAPAGRPEGRPDVAPGGVAAFDWWATDPAGGATYLTGRVRPLA